MADSSVQTAGVAGAVHTLSTFANDLVAIFDADGACVYLNPTGRRLLRIGATVSLDYRLDDVPASADRDRFATALDTVGAGRHWSGSINVASTVTGEFPTRSTFSPVTLDDGTAGTGWIARDTTTDRDVIKSLRERAFYDPVTGLSHRSLFLDRLDLLLRRTTDVERHLAVLFVVPDRFKESLNRFDHDVRELLLKSVAQRIPTALPDNASLHRWGEEDFVVLCESVADTDGALAVADTIGRSFREPFVISGTDLYLSASIGVALARPGEMTTDELIRHADTAGQSARAAGNGTVRVFDGELRERAMRRAEIEDALRGAGDRGELRLYYQPEVLLRTNQIVACEALVRWQHPEWGLVSPGEFIPVAEASNLIIELGDWVMREAFRQCAEWTAEFPDHNPVSVAVNISSRQFTADDFEEKVQAAIDDTGVSPARLCLEITESVLLDDAEETIERLARLKELGVHLAIDDFGTGYSSLSYLRKFPVDILKVDQAFVAGLGHDPEDSAIVQAVIHMGQALNMTTLAEGVETAHHVIELRELSCDIAQGYHFARPVPAEDFAKLLAAGDDWLDGNG